MTRAIDMQSQKKTIPKVSSIGHQARDIDGVKWAVCRLPAQRALPVLSRLISDVGQVLAEVICSADRDIDPSVEATIRGAVSSFAPSTGALTLAAVKAIFMTSAIGKIGKIDLGWYAAEMLPGLLSANGVPIDSMDELDETGIGPVHLVELVWLALVENFRPTSSARAMFDGSAGAEKTTGSPIQGKSKYKGETSSAGRPAPTQEMTG
jgi:hypothetical protein